MLKIACIGNMNNNMFSLVRYLRDRDYNADLILLNNEPAHFHPTYDDFTLEYQEFTKKVTWGIPSGFRGISNDRVKADLEEYNYFIGCGTTPAFFNRLGWKLNMFIPYGHDFYDIPFFKRHLHPRKLINHNVVAKYQRKGIQEADHIVWSATNDSFNKVIEELGVGQKIRKKGVPMVYSGLYNPLNIKKMEARSHWFYKFKELRNNNEILLFHYSRIIWKTPPDKWSNKRNDKLIRGFASFVKGSVKTAHLMLCEYGSDILVTKELIKALGIEHNVTWFPLLPRKEIMLAISQADICVGELDLSWLLYGVVFEALTMRKPFMGYREDHLYEGLYPELYPMISVHSEEEVDLALKEYEKDTVKYVDMGKAAGEWFNKYCVSEPLEDICQLIEAADITD